MSQEPAGCSDLHRRQTSLNLYQQILTPRFEYYTRRFICTGHRSPWDILPFMLCSGVFTNMHYVHTASVSSYTPTKGGGDFPLTLLPHPRLFSYYLYMPFTSNKIYTFIWEQVFWFCQPKHLVRSLHSWDKSLPFQSSRQSFLHSTEPAPKTHGPTPTNRNWTF